MGQSNPKCNSLIQEFDKFIDPSHDKQHYPYPKFGMAVADGWYPLLRRLLTVLCTMGWDGYIHQVKEKFGGLRFYTNWPVHIKDKDISWAVRALIRETERESYHICMKCGLEDTGIRDVDWRNEDKLPSFYRNDLHWILTLCNYCHQNRKHFGSHFWGGRE